MSKDSGVFVAYIDCQCGNCEQPSLTCSVLERNTSKRFRVRCLNCGECTDWMTKPEAIAAWYKKYIDAQHSKEDQAKVRQAGIIHNIDNAANTLRHHIASTATANKAYGELLGYLEMLHECIDIPF